VKKFNYGDKVSVKMLGVGHVIAHECIMDGNTSKPTGRLLVKFNDADVYPVFLFELHNKQGGLYCYSFEVTKEDTNVSL
jgi:hypothetical protein